MICEINTGPTWELLAPILGGIAVILLYNAALFFIDNYKKRNKKD